MKVKCNICGYIGDEAEFPKGRDFFQQGYIKSCPKKCSNLQSPGGASLRMMPELKGNKRPFEYIRPESKDKSQLGKTIHRSEEAS